MQQRRVLQRRRGGAHGTSVLLLVAALAACNGKIGANGGSGQVSVGATVYGPTGLHRLSRIEYDNTLARSAGRHPRVRVRGAARGRQRSFRQRLRDAARFGRADRVGRDAGGRGRGARPCRHRPAQHAGRLHTVRRGRQRLSGELRAQLRAARLPAPADRRRGQRLPRACRRSPSRPTTSTSASSWCCGRCCRTRASSTASRSARRSPGETGLYRLDDYEIGDPAVVLPAGARRRRTRCSTWPARGRARRPIRARARPRRELLADPRGAASGSSASTRSGSATTSCRWRPTWRRRCAPRPTRWSTRVVFERHGDYFDLFTATRDVRQRRRWPRTTGCRRPAARRAPGSPTARARAAASSRTARCWRRARSSTTPAPRCAASSCAAACCARTIAAAAAQRRRRRAARRDHRQRAARSTATPPTAAAAAPTATTDSTRSASASRTTIAPARYRDRRQGRTPSAPIAGDGEVVGVGDVQRPGRARRR